MIDLHRVPRVARDERQHERRDYHRKRRAHFSRAALMLARFDGRPREWTARDRAHIRSGIILGFDVGMDIDSSDVALTCDVLERYYRRYRSQLIEQSNTESCNLLGEG